ncbi:MAG: winged helix-turn-helix domain-containing protein, partial [Patescibacteria group bacterium]
MLEQLFGSRTRVKLLRLFLSNPQEEYYVRELTRRMNEQINSIRRELSNLEDMGLLLSEEREGKKYYKVNQDHLMFPELRALFLK